MKYADTRCKGGAQLGEGGGDYVYHSIHGMAKAWFNEMTQSHLVAAVAIATAIIVVIGVILGTGPWRSRETYLPASSHTNAFAKPLNLALRVSPLNVVASWAQERAVFKAG